MASTNYQVTVDANVDLRRLEPLWKDIEKRAEHRFFLSWTWISTWLKTFKPKAYLIEVRLKNVVVGIALVCLNKAKRHKVLRVKQCILHETGIPQHDQQWIEYNGLLLDEQHSVGARKALLQGIEKSFQWDELLIGVATEQEVHDIEQTTKLKKHIRWQTCSHAVDLASLRDNNSDYLSSLSRNARSQIKRSLKKYQALGEVKVEHATSLAQAEIFIEELAPLHKERWGYGVQQSGFANPDFCEFHSNLIEHGWQEKQIDVVKVSAGEHAFAYFYNFLYQNRVYFYLSALRFSQDNALKPGLLGHALCIQEYLDKGYDCYDLMGGGESYKDRLAAKQNQMYRVALQKPSIKINAEILARRVKRSILTKKQTIKSE